LDILKIDLAFLRFAKGGSLAKVICVLGVSLTYVLGSKNGIKRMKQGAPAGTIEAASVVLRNQ